MKPTSTYLYLALALVTVGCPDTDSPIGGESSSGDASTSTTSGLTVSPETTASPDSSTSLDPSGHDSTSSTSSSGSESTESSTTGDEPPPSGGYGDCAQENGSPAACLLVESCLYSGEVGVCSAGGCSDASDCPSSELPPAVPPSDTPATIECVDVTGRGLLDCILDCAEGLTGACPEGMTCVGLGLTAICVWPVIPSGGGACPDSDLGSTVPQTVMGNTVGLMDDHYSLCGFGSGAEDAQYLFTAPVTATYIFDTFGSSYDTVLAVLDSCGDHGELGCGDDQVGSQSSVTLEMSEGQSVIVVVDGYAGASGAFVLHISVAPAFLVQPLPKPAVVLEKQRQHGIEFSRIE